MTSRKWVYCSVKLTFNIGPPARETDIFLAPSPSLNLSFHKLFTEKGWNYYDPHKSTSPAFDNDHSFRKKDEVVTDHENTHSDDLHICTSYRLAQIWKWLGKRWGKRVNKCHVGLIVPYHTLPGWCWWCLAGGVHALSVELIPLVGCWFAHAAHPELLLSLLTKDGDWEGGRPNVKSSLWATCVKPTVDSTFYFIRNICMSSESSVK